MHTKKRIFISLVLVVALSVSFTIPASAFWGWDDTDLPNVVGVHDYTHGNSSHVVTQSGGISTLAQIINNSYATTVLLDQIAYALNKSSSPLMDELKTHGFYLNALYRTLNSDDGHNYVQEGFANLNTKLGLLSTTNRTLSTISGTMSSVDSKIAGFDTSFNDSMSNLYDLWDTLFDTVTVTNTQLTSILTVLSTIANNGSGGTVTFPNYIQIDPWLDSGQWKTPGETGYSVDSWWWDQSFYQHMIANDLSDFKDLFEEYVSDSSSSVDLTDIQLSLSSLKSYEDRVQSSSWLYSSGSWYYRVWERLNAIASNTSDLSGGGSSSYDPIIKDETAAAREVFHYISYDENGMFHVSPDDLWDFAYLFDDFKNFFASDGNPVDLFSQLQADELWSWFSEETAQSIDSSTTSVEVVNYLGW